MIFKMLRALHEKTIEEYKGSLETSAWKEKVLRIHEESGFLFYYDLLEEERDGLLRLTGELVSGNPRERTAVCLYDGQGNLLGEGICETSPQDREDHRRGMVGRKNTFLLRWTSALGRPVEDLTPSERKRALQRLEMDLSLVSDHNL